MTPTTPDLCDAFEGHVQVLEPRFRPFGGRAAFAGRVTTVRCFEDNSKVRDVVATPGKGRVLVVDGAGSLRRALLGDLLAQKAVDNGWEGVLVHGCVRDVEVLAMLDLGVFALAAHPLKTDKRGLGEIDVDVAFAGVAFTPGAWLYADANGVIVAADELVLPAA